MPCFGSKKRCESPAPASVVAPAAASSVPSPAPDSVPAKQWRKIVILTGAPGSGKGTHATRMISTYKIPQLSTGDMLRAAITKGTEVGLSAKQFMERGELVPDQVVTDIINARIEEMDCGWGFLLDGYPRSVAQAEALDAALAKRGESVSLVVSLDVPDAILEERICGRWIHKASGRSYHLKLNPPRVVDPAPLDDVTGELLEQRSDDTAEVLQKRLATFHAQTAPVVAHYDKHRVVVRVNGNQPVENVWRDITSAMERL